MGKTVQTRWASKYPRSRSHNENVIRSVLSGGFGRFFIPVYLTGILQFLGSLSLRVAYCAGLPSVRYGKHGFTARTVVFTVVTITTGSCEAVPAELDRHQHRPELVIEQISHITTGLAPVTAPPRFVLTAHHDDPPLSAFRNSILVPGADS